MMGVYRQLSLGFSDAVFYCGFNVVTVLLMLPFLNCVRQIFVVVFVVPVRIQLFIACYVFCVNNSLVYLHIVSFRMVLCELRFYYSCIFRAISEN